ncbi:peptidoglycan bridge formation glycyltransferase FemA/FemB family protein [Pseudonocardia sp. P1]|nr:tRNA-dependent lipid II--amino acid ligase [Pseudonocardia sp. Ae707_Ps1]
MRVSASAHPRCTVTEVRRPAARPLHEWDAFVDRLSGDTVQKSGWADLRATAGFTARYFFVHDHGDLVGGAQLLERRLPLLGRVGYVSNAPLIDDAVGDSAIGVPALCAHLLRAARAHLSMLVVQPPEGREDVSDFLLAQGLRPSEAGIAPAATLRLRLDRCEEEIRAGLGRRLRQWTRQWPRRGVTVRPAGRRDLGAVAALLAETGRHQGFDSFPEDYLRTMYDIFADRGELQIMVGEVAGVPVACEVLTGCGDVVRSRFGGTDRSAEVQHLNVSAAVEWHSILWARSAGYRWFDFGGVLPETRASLSGAPEDLGPIPGPDRFKLRFGGDLYIYPQAVEWFRSPLLRAGYDLTNRSEYGRRAVRVVRGRIRTAR